MSSVSPGVVEKDGQQGSRLPGKDLKIVRVTTGAQNMSLQQEAFPHLKSKASVEPEEATFRWDRKQWLWDP